MLSFPQLGNGELCGKIIFVVFFTNALKLLKARFRQQVF